jgi:thymidylate synthase (FAD)
MRPTIYFEPKITLLSAPSFLNPDHLPGVFLGEASPVEQLSEYAGRVCYMSQANPGGKTTGEYLQHILELGHGSVIEHGQFSYLLEGVSRSLTHELIRHRVGTSVSQLSQRFVDESDTAFVCPPEIAKYPRMLSRWESACEFALDQYKALCANLDEAMPLDGLSKTTRRKRIREAARAVLPNCVETKLVWSCNLRELRHILLLRGSPHADLEIQQFAKALWALTRDHAPNALADLTWSDTDGITSTIGG